LPQAGIIFFTTSRILTFSHFIKDEQYNYRNCLLPYEIIRQLGEGGFGKVMLAKDRVTSEEVAIKFLRCNHNGILHKIY